MNAMESAWMVLKGNPDARVQVSNYGGKGNTNISGFSARDFAAHPAAIGAANRQSMAISANRKKIRDFIRVNGGQQLPDDKLFSAAEQMVTPEQRASMKNTSFDLNFKNPKYIHRLRSQNSRSRGEGTKRRERQWGRDRRDESFNQAAMAQEQTARNKLQNEPLQQEARAKAQEASERKSREIEESRERWAREQEGGL
jgi:hypothetical protein